MEDSIKQIKLNWVLAHEPYHVFIKAANSFAEEVYVETNGQCKINGSQAKDQMIYNSTPTRTP